MSQSNSNQIVLGYWAIRGLAEPSRLALHYAKVSYTDKMYVQGDAPEYSRDEWLSEKQKLGLDFPNLPYLLEGDLKLTQSKAILYYIGRKFNLMGKTPSEEANVMMLCEEAHDFRMTLNGVFYGPKGESKEERKQYAETVVSEHLQKIENYLGKQKTKFAVGNQPTVADFQLFDYIDAGLTLDGARALLDKYSNIKRLMETIQTLPEIKDYITKSHAQLPLNNKVAKFGGKVVEQ